MTAPHASVPKKRPLKNKHPNKFNVLLSKSDTEALQAYIRTQPDKPYATEAIRRILRSWLNDHGFADM